MKSRDLFTTYDLIASNYTITSIAPGRYVHKFTPATTSTVYEFEANATPVIEEGQRYNVGYKVDSAGRNIVEQSALSKASEVNPALSYLAAKQIAKEKYSVEKAKNDQRVSHTAKDGYYLGTKYAYRMFGLAITRNTFDSYLTEIKHPSVPCTTSDPERSFANDQSIAYKEDGLQDAMDRLFDNPIKVTEVFYKSPHYSKRFSIRGINAITDKK
jgi:L-amino acid N-acyltransferase YncA